jgi:hypothetical protein
MCINTFNTTTNTPLHQLHQIQDTQTSKLLNQSCTHHGKLQLPKDYSKESLITSPAASGSEPTRETFRTTERDPNSLILILYRTT